MQEVVVYVHSTAVVRDHLNSPDRWSIRIPQRWPTQWRVSHHGKTLLSITSIEHDTVDRGDIERLIGALDHSQLSVRVVAAEQLRRLTGKTFLYRADLTASRRAARVNAWKSALEQGHLSWSEHDEF